jgi:transposase-like protein
MVQRKKQWGDHEKLTIVSETHQSGISLTTDAGIHGVNPSQFSGWRRMYRDGTLKTKVETEPEALVMGFIAAHRRVEVMVRILGDMTLEVELMQPALTTKRSDAEGLVQSLRSPRACCPPRFAGVGYPLVRHHGNP